MKGNMSLDIIIVWSDIMIETTYMKFGKGPGRGGITRVTTQP